MGGLKTNAWHVGHHQLSRQFCKIVDLGALPVGDGNQYTPEDEKLRDQLETMELRIVSAMGDLAKMIEDAPSLKR